MLLLFRWFSLSCLRNGIQKALLDQYDIKVQPLNEVHIILLGYHSFILHSSIVRVANNDDNYCSLAIIIIMAIIHNNS